MNSNSSTTLTESTITSSAVFGLDGVNTISLEPYTPHQRAPTPSNDIVGFNDTYNGELIGSKETSDEDADISDGGAPLVLSQNHSQVLDAGMEMLDVEIMGQNNLLELHMGNDLSTTMEQHSALTTSDGLNPVADATIFSAPFIPNHMHNMGNEVDLPYTMSAVSLQLQLLQDQAQQDEPMTDFEDHAHSAVQANGPLYSTESNTSSFLPSLPTMSSQVGSVDPLAMAEAGDVSWTDTAWPECYIDPVAAALWLPMPQMTQWGVEMMSNAGLNFHSIHLTYATSGGIPLYEFDDSITYDDLSDSESEADADQDEVQEDRNLNFFEFLEQWNRQFAIRDDGRRRPSDSVILPSKQQLFVGQPSVQRKDLQGEQCDIQGLNWGEIGVTRSEAREMRERSYVNYTSEPQLRDWNPHRVGARLANDQNFFRFRRMVFGQLNQPPHFQLRDIFACRGRDQYFYASGAKIVQYRPQDINLPRRPTIAMDLSDVDFRDSHGGDIKISTLTTDHGLLVAGGYYGEYGLVNLRASKGTKHIQGLVTESQNSIMNHVQVHLSRGSYLPLVSFACNDDAVRILDVSTNTFIAAHFYDQSVNCTATSPDQRLRVQVGDTQKVNICDAATGKILQSLDGHCDFGFACDWADDGWTVASGNQDMLVKIWDARKWTNSSGQAQPLATIAADMAGVRKLKFSPLGSGKMVLVAAESADIVSVIDTQIYTRKQTLNFFGAIAGFDFTNGGDDLIVANCDPVRGGFIEYERCDFDMNHEEEVLESRYKKTTRKYAGYDSTREHTESTFQQTARRANLYQGRRAARLGETMDYF